MGKRLPLAILACSTGLLTIPVQAADRTYYETFTDTSRTNKGYIWEEKFVQTNNAGPALTNALSYTNFARRGEFAGIKLGMSMADVVSAWGKPRRLFTFCIIGPRFWYGQKYEGDISLFFVGDRLVVIAIDGDTARALKFDNGLFGSMSQPACEKVLGEPAVRDPDRRSGPYVGELAYRTGEFRVDLGFYNPRATELGFIAVSLEKEAARKGYEKIGADVLPHHGTNL